MLASQNVYLKAVFSEQLAVKILLIILIAYTHCLLLTAHCKLNRFYELIRYIRNRPAKKCNCAYSR